MTPTDDAAITAAAHVLREKIDVLLDRLTDAALGQPTPGTAQWHNLVHSPGDLTRITRGVHRAEVRARIAARAGVTDPDATTQYPPTPAGSAPLSRRGRRNDPAQLSMF